MKDLSIIVLAYNEAGNLQGAIRDIQSAALSLDDYEIIIVNDGSTDGTGAAADLIASRNPEVMALHHSENRGLRAGYETGLAEARFSRVIWMPADREITYASICRVFAAVGAAEIVSIYHGNPVAREWFRRVLTWVSTLEINLLCWHNKRYFQGTNIYSTDLARSLPRTESGFLFCAEMYLTALELGYEAVEIPITHQPRTYGQSSAVSWAKIWHAQWAVMKIWWRLKVRRNVQGLMC